MASFFLSLFVYFFIFDSSENKVLAMNEKLMIQVTQELLSTFCYILHNYNNIILIGSWLACVHCIRDACRRSINKREAQETLASQVLSNLPSVSIQ